MVILLGSGVSLHIPLVPAGSMTLMTHCVRYLWAVRVYQTCPPIGDHYALSSCWQLQTHAGEWQGRAPASAAKSNRYRHKNSRSVVSRRQNDGEEFDPSGVLHIGVHSWCVLISVVDRRVWVSGWSCEARYGELVHKSDEGLPRAPSILWKLVGWHDSTRRLKCKSNSS